MAEEEQQQAPAPAPSGGGSKDVSDNKAIAAIGYLGILFLIPLLAKKDSDFAQYHAKQGMILFIFEIVLWIVAMIPILGWILAFIGWIFAFICFIMGLVNALNGVKKPLPLIGSFAGKVNV